MVSCAGTTPITQSGLCVTSIPSPTSGNGPSLNLALTSSKTQPIEIQALKTKLTDLESKLSSISSSLNNGLNNLSNPDSTCNPQSNSLGFQGVPYNGLFFPDPESVEMWLRANLTHPLHGLFVDIVSFGKFFGNYRYIECNSTLNEIYLSSKIGYATTTDATVAASFQNNLPWAYGRAGSALSTSTNTRNDAQDLVTQQELPGLPDFKNGMDLMGGQVDVTGLGRSVARPDTN